MKSIIGDQECCYVCGSYNLLEWHHCFGGSNRKHSEKYGLKARLCRYCHRGENGVHGRDGAKLSLRLKQDFQRLFEEDYSRDEFIHIFGRNFI